jgi:hypothetical protein
MYMWSLTTRDNLLICAAIIVAMLVIRMIKRQPRWRARRARKEVHHILAYLHKKGERAGEPLLRQLDLLQEAVIDIGLYDDLLEKRDKQAEQKASPART